MKSFDEQWRAWISRNLDEDCPKDLLFKILHDAGFSYESIRQELHHEPQLPLDRIFSPLAHDAEPPPVSVEARYAEWLDASPPLEAPVWLREGVREQQERIPYLDAGDESCRGFEKRRMESDIFDEVRRRFESAKRSLAPESNEAIGRFIGTTSPSLPPTLLALDGAFNDVVLELMKPVHEEWCGFPLEPSACYGFRVYLDGAYLHDHVDRPKSHIVSSTLCVDQRTYAPWPLHAEDVDGRAHHIECEPGEFVLYESARIKHGRPVPLNGRYYAALFIHYRPAENWELWLESPQAWLEQLRG